MSTGAADQAMRPNTPNPGAVRSVPPLLVILSGGFVLLLAIVAGGLTFFALAEPRLGAPSRLAVLGEVHEFRLTNQLGQAVTLADLRSNVWVANVIFTRCAGPCPRLSQRMSDLQRRFRHEPRVKLVSFTADPAFDTPGVLQRYAGRFQADPDRWQFLTGPTTALHRLVTRELLLAIVDNAAGVNNAPADLFVHSTKFILLDQRARLRGVFDGEHPNVSAEVGLAVRQLLRERS